MAGNVVRIQLEGRSSDDGHVRFNEFLSRLESLRQVLTLIEQDLVDGTKGAVVYRVIDLSYSSPACVVLEARPVRQNVRPELPEKVVDRFFDTLEFLRGSPLVSNEHVTFRVLEAYKGLIKSPRRDLDSFVISSNDRKVTIDESLEQRIEGMLGDVRTAFGSFSGALDSINLHADANRFTIYPAAGPNRLSCHFNRKQFASVVDGLGRHVSVKGTLRFYGKEPFPHSVEVEELEVLPRDSELPSLASIRGIAPKATKGQDSVAFVRQLRDEDS